MFGSLFNRGWSDAYNHLGTPQELTNQDGDVIWLSYDRAWGGSFDTIYKQQFIDNYAVKENELQPIKFQGQSLDVETAVFVNIVVTQFNIKRLKPHWH